ncbi:MAG: D-glycero-D-manno-heptose 1-phosphate guanosyltransferase [uncultured Sulfurovum sp.]|uniref:D-glycero-D-manno-heptose 1-phosphate guanosyltransferase n=1 Tax=uncultured Sulfurovum sp. TaxID=269237 RepID=A0A6S6T4V0_9BACT|nr:MAG: D-glycero-D-manno-heptose 1-phosphate guanosyltransferase [uncultured Sulfurovum sp.]
MISTINKKYQNIIDLETTVINALKVMNNTSINLLVIINEQKFMGLVSIGDIRRAILNNIDLNTTYVKDILRKDILVANTKDSMEEIKEMMLEQRIVCMPVVDNKNNLQAIHYWDEIFSEKKVLENIDVDVVIMAGGFGTRLKPITNIIPKPLIPVGEKPIIEIIIDNFMKHNVSSFYISVNYKAKMIQDYLQEKESQACQLTYFIEDQPLGTIGSLYLIKKQLTKPVFVSNCDIIIEEDYYDIYKYHRENNNDITVVSAIKHVEIPYGVMETEKGGNLISMTEKPEYTFQINTGMYILEPHVIQNIPDNEFYHITELIEETNKKGKVGVFPIPEKSWHDIGQWKEYTNTLAKYSQTPINL